MTRARYVAFASVFLFSGIGLITGSYPVQAQTYYYPGDVYAPGQALARPRGYSHGEPRFYVPFLKPSTVYEEPPQSYRGAYTTSPSGQRVFYVPAPREAEELDEDDDVVVRAQPQAQQRAQPQEPGRAASSAIDPRFRRQTVPYSGPHKPGTIVISSAERHLYLVQNDGTALRYGIGVGREGFGWRGDTKVSRKAEWPDWRPPAEMIARRPDLPRFMPGGPGNPLGARALYLGSSLYRIHGTNEPHTIGKAVSSGCFRMINDDVTDLYTRIDVGARVVVQ